MMNFMVNFSELMEQLQAISVFPGITPVDILILPDPVDSAVQKILRRGPMGVVEIASVLNLPEDEAKQVAAQRSLSLRLCSKRSPWPPARR